MPIELRMLSCSILLGLIQLVIATQFSTQQRGLKWNMSARDVKMPDLTGVAGRLDRAFWNFMETFPFFAASVLLLAALNRFSPRSALGAELYFLARVVYVPVYAVGTPMIRTAIWAISVVGIVMVLSGAIF